MILSQTQRTVVTEGDIGETTKMKISLAGGVGEHIIKMVTELGYKKPIESLVREGFCNALDSHFAAGKPEEPVLVKLYKNNTNNWVFEIQDFGLGLSENEFYRYFMSIGESTKQQSNEFIGGFGLGAKSCLSYCESFEIISRKDGKELKFLVFKGSDVPEATKIWETDTSESNGIIIRIPLNSYWDRNEFIAAIKEQLCYFPTAAIQVEGDNFNYMGAKVYGNELFEWSEMYPSSEMHISLKGVNYPINWKGLKVEPIYIPIAVKIDLNEGVRPVLNREELIWSEDTKNLILAKIKTIATWFVEKYNSNWKEYETFLEAYELIGQKSYDVELAGESFNISCLLNYSFIPVKELKIKGIEIKTPEYYKNINKTFFANYTCLGIKEGYNKLNTKKAYRIPILNRLQEGYKLILVNSVPVGYFRQYLSQKYGKNYLFIKKEKDKVLGSRHYNVRDCETEYRYILNLAMEKKETWRDRIKEYQIIENQLHSHIIDETAEFIPEEWLKAKKEELKANRERGYSSSNYKSLNKKDGDITISIAKMHTYKDSLVFEKKVFRINELHKQPNLFIYLIDTPENRIKLNDLQGLVGEELFKICIIGKNEYKKLPKLKGFKTMEEFISEGSKPFRRIVTAWKISELLDNYNTIVKQNRDIVSDCLEKLNEDITKLEDYYAEWNINCNTTVQEAMLKVAEENNFWDHEILYLVPKLEKELKKYDFLTVFEKPNYYSSERQKTYKRVIAQMLLFRQKYYGDFENFDIVVTPKVKEELVEQED